MHAPGDIAERADALSGGMRTLTCPTCQASIRARLVSAERQLRCAMCRGHLSGDSLAPVQWLYPERRRTNPGTTPGLTDPKQEEAAATAGTLDPSRPDLIPAGPRRIGRYELRGELGRGGVGVVYAAWDTELRRELALKVLLAGGFASAQARQRFVGEARAAAGLHHVHIVRIFDMGEVEEQPWFAMERVFGPSLEEVIDSGGPLPLEEAVRIGAAVAHAHAAGVVHRDLKPGNVLLDGDGHPRIADFGLARSLTDPRHLTATAQILGTPSYMPPEVARAEPKIDWIRADVYGLGAVLYAAITGRPPVDGLSMNQRLRPPRLGNERRCASCGPRCPWLWTRWSARPWTPRSGGATPTRRRWPTICVCFWPGSRSMRARRRPWSVGAAGGVDTPPGWLWACWSRRRWARRWPGRR